MKHGVAFLSATVALLIVSMPALAAEGQFGTNWRAGGVKRAEAAQSGASNAPGLQTDAQLDRADEEESGHRLELMFLSVEAGRESLALKAATVSNCGPPSSECGLVDSARVKSKDLGATYGAGFGARLFAFTLGRVFATAIFPIGSCGPSVPRPACTFRSVASNRTSRWGPATPRWVVFIPTSARSASTA